MNPRRSWLRYSLVLLCLLLPPTIPATSVAATKMRDQFEPLPRKELRLVQQRECSQRVGPFATQDTAWQKLNQAKGQGYGVSGVFPCYDGYGSRGYCFNVFARC